MINVTSLRIYSALGYFTSITAMHLVQCLSTFHTISPEPENRTYTFWGGGEMKTKQVRGGQDQDASKRQLPAAGQGHAHAYHQQTRPHNCSFPSQRGVPTPPVDTSSQT